MPMQQHIQKELLSNCDEIKVDEVGYCVEKRENLISDDVTLRDEAVPDKSSTSGDTQFDFIVNMLCNNEVGSGEQDKQMNLFEIRDHLPTQESKLKLQTEAVDIRALSASDLRKKADESDNLSHEQKGSLFHMLSKYRAKFTSKPGLCNLFEYEFKVQCSEPLLVIHDRCHFQSGQLSENK